MSVPGNEGRTAQARVNVRGGLRVFLVYFWYLEGWTPRNEASLEAVWKQARSTRHPSTYVQIERPKTDYVVASGSPKGRISQMEVVEDFESRPHEAVSFVVKREKEVKEWNEQKMPKVLSGYSGGRLPGRGTKERGREEGAVDEFCEEREMRSQIARSHASRRR